MVRSTQVNMGLHIFGCRYDVDRAVEYAVTVLHKDTMNHRSIIRLILEMLGVDYDEARSRVFYVPELNMSSVEVLKKAREVAVRALRRLALMRDVSDEDVVKVVVECVREVFRVNIAV
jgi:cobalamin biosynthesis Mg chelatase CobN